MANKATQFTTGNTASKGRPKGVKNRTTEEIRQFIQQVMDKNLATLEDDLARMSPTNKWSTIEKLTKYFLPALSKNDNTNEVSGALSILVEYADNKPGTDTGNE